MKLAAICALLGLAISSAPDVEQVTFDGVQFAYASSSNASGAKLIEFVPSSDSIDDWKKLVSFQCHPSATALKDVINPYLEARKQFVATRPEFFRNHPDALDDISIVLFLGKPGMPQLEFVIARFVETKERGVVMVAYSQRFPMSKNVDVSDAMENKSRWKDQLSSIPVEQITASCARHTEE